MFGDGAFGPEGAALCCVTVFLVPLLFAIVLRYGGQIPGSRRVAVGLGMPVLAYLGVGALFGDIIGIAAAALVFFFTGTVAVTGFSTLTNRTQWQQKAEGYYFKQFGSEKPKRSESDGEITIEM